MIGHLFTPDGRGLTDVVGAALTHQRLVVLLVAALVVLLPTAPVTGPFLESSRSRTASTIRIGVLTAGLAYSTILIASGTFSPFLYFQF
jgi:alginate O-acetyltransferase complex protein AlgI